MPNSDNRTQWTLQNMFNWALDRSVSLPKLMFGQLRFKSGSGWDKVELDPLEGYKASDTDRTNSTNWYFGFVRSDGAWYILRRQTSPNVTAERYAKGASGYTTEWGNKASPTGGYDYFYAKF